MQTYTRLLKGAITRERKKRKKERSTKTGIVFIKYKKMSNIEKFEKKIVVYHLCISTWNKFYIIGTVPQG